LLLEATGATAGNDRTPTKSQSYLFPRFQRKFNGTTTIQRAKKKNNNNNNKALATKSFL
jgi:hypothetical protein